MKKGTAIVALLAVIAAIVGLGYIVLYGVGENAAGSARDTKLGLDLAGGVSITYEVVGEEAPTKEDLDDTIFKLRKRIDQYSTEAQVYPEGDRRISIEIPGVSDANAILQDLGSPGSLYFIRSVGSDGTLNYQYMETAGGEQVYKEDTTYFCYVSSMPYLYDKETDEVAVDANGAPIPYTIIERAHVKPQYELTKSIEDIIADGCAVLSGTDVASSEAVSHTDEYNVTQNVVALQFTGEAAQIFGNETGAVAGKAGLYGTIAIYYDQELLSVPMVSNRIDGGEAQITGMSDFSEAEELAQNIRIGGLKLELQELRSNVVGAQLGTEAIATSILAGMIGLVIVIIFMITVYRIPGLASSLALMIYIILIMLGINLFEITLTLPGIAGIILSVGMAVDANVIIFARIREELADGITVESAIKSGFSKALSAIIDGNVTTLIAAIVLMIMGSGSIKGFAYTLALGIIASMFTALFITKLILNAFYAVGFKSEKWYGKVKEKKTIDFLKKRKVFFAISIGVIVLGFVFMGINKGTTGDFLNYSLEFKGGSAASVTFESMMERDVIENNVIPGIEAITGDANVQWQTVNDSNEVVFKTRVLDATEREQFEDLMTTSFGVDSAKISFETIGSTISGEMKRESLLAVSIATICMLIYIWFRFSDIRFGASAVCALIHDVLVVLTFYAVVRLSVGSTFIACMLTIVGYSINATIVIFDRVRENLKAMKKKDTLEDMVNKSITQTLTRSIFTSLTTAVMVIVLYILGVSSIREFALPLIIGIVCGTYSSVCITGALWFILRKKFPQVESDD